MNSETSRLAMINVITQIERSRETQMDVDSIYEQLCEAIKHEMNQRIPKHGSSRGTSRRHKVRKPYWDDNLNTLWNTMRENEHKYLNCRDNRQLRSRLRMEYVSSRNIFDRELKKCERIYRQSKAFEIEHMSTNDPNEFWRKIKNLAPQKRKDIPIEIVDSLGSVIRDEHVVFERWRQDFQNLYNSQDDNDFDEDYYNRAKLHKHLLEMNIADPLYEPNHTLNTNITVEECAFVVNKAKLGSACGLDSIPYDVLKYPVIISVLQHLFQMIFDFSIIPSIWRKSVICPIIKNSESDARVPMHYRGISLLSCISKLYSAFLNKRLTEYLEGANILADEQNGFRSKRSCEDHVFSLNSIIRNNKSVFTAFIDLKRCFDYIDRDMLLYKLLNNNIDGKMYNSIKSIYASSSSCVRINQKMTNWFDCVTGVKQGCTLSPTLFSIFANDLAEEIKDLDLGVPMDDIKISLLMYADDIVLISDSEEKLQTMLNTIHDWCKKWRVLINTSKSKCIHFRKGRAQRTDFTFRIGDNELETVEAYKYLGVIFHEKHDFSNNCDALAKGAGRALGSIINKIHNYKEFGFKSFEKLYNSCVIPILDYCASVWGNKHFQQIDNIQNRAMRYFMGVHRFTPVLAMLGDTGWLPSRYRRWTSMLRLWNRLVCMDTNRLTYKLFETDYRQCSNNWCSDLKTVMYTLGLNDNFDHLFPVNLSQAKTLINSYYSNIWARDIQNLPKLRTYRLFKREFKTEEYLLLNLKKNERSLLAQFRTGILPLRIETGRYVGESVEDRHCTLCNSGAIETEKHFLLECSLYSNVRNTVFDNLLTDISFVNLVTEHKLEHLMTKYPRKMSKYIVAAFMCRRNRIYS
jgi:hypothetical protein